MATYFTSRIVGEELPLIAVNYTPSHKCYTVKPAYSGPALSGKPAFVEKNCLALGKTCLL